MNPLTTLTDDGLTRKAQGGDAEALDQLYKRFSPSVYRFALQMSGNRTVAEEITQEVFMKILRNELRFEESKGNLLPFLLGVTRNLLRMQRREEPEEGLDATEEPAAPDLGLLEDLTRRESLEQLRQAVQALPKNYREVVVLCELEELSYEEAAGALNCPVGTVRSRLARARALLALKLASKLSEAKVMARCTA